MSKNTIINNPVNIHVQISKAAEGSWEVKPSLIAFPTPRKSHPKNIIFLLDNSGSMQQNGRLEKVKTAVSNLLDKLNPIDTFSIVSFNNTAHFWVKYQQAAPDNIRHAKSRIQQMTPDGGTSFKAAFTAINTRELFQPANHPTVIFLTDGEDNQGCSAHTLSALFPNKTLPRVIPIGVWLSHQNTLLNTLATLSHGKALYINDDNPTTYQNVFDEAFKQATEHSHGPTQLDMVIKAKTAANSTSLDITRTLNHVYYDGASATSTSLYFNSPTPPASLKLRFRCDNTSLQAERTLTPAECQKLTHGQHLDINIRAFKWKDNRSSSWIFALGSVMIGLAVLATVAMFILSAPPINVWLWQTLAMNLFAGLVGLSLFISGVMAIARKTIFLPTKFSAEAAQENMRQTPIGQQGFFPQQRPRTQIVANIALAAGGAAIGYFAGTTASAAKAVIATGISPSLFILGCSVAGAIALLLLAYGCTRLYNACSSRQPTPRLA